MLKNSLIIILLIIITVTGIYLLTKVGDKENNTNDTQPPMQFLEIDPSKSYTAVIKTTLGDVSIKLNAKTAPITSNNFVSLARKEFYNGTIFHRVINGFMIQGGDPNTKQPESSTNVYGTGNPGYKFDDEAFEGEYLRGTIAMANSGPNTNGSQFFIMHRDYPLPKNYVIFGEVINGLDAVDKIAESNVTISASGELSKPVQPTRIESIEIIES
ncbi:MAG TPA: peptidylprolyl isomerase [Candidatus Paceibacterota bacterium]